MEKWKQRPFSRKAAGLSHFFPYGKRPGKYVETVQKYFLFHTVVENCV